MPAQAGVQIDRMRLSVEGLDEAAARRLGRLVAERLAGDLQLPPGTSGLDAIQLELPAKAAEAPEELAWRVAAAIARAIAGEIAGAGSRAGATLGAGAALDVAGGGGGGGGQP